MTWVAICYGNKIIDPMTQYDHVDSKMSYPKSTDKSDYDRVGERPSWDLGDGVIGTDA